MSLTPEVISVSEDPDAADDKYTVTLRMRDDETGKTVGPNYTVAADSKDEMKDKIRPHLQAFLEKQARHDQLLALAQTALSELITELEM